MAKRKRIPELVVGKIYIDDGRGTNVYTLDVDNDNDGALRIGDNRNGAVATINQNTGEISATRIRGSSLHGDGSEIEGITQQQQAEIDSAKLVTVTSDRLFFVFQEAGEKGLSPYDPAEAVTIKAKLSNVDEAVVWSSDEPTLNYSTNGDTLTFTADDMKAFDSVTITATVDNLYDSITIGKVVNGATGKSAVTILMPNDTVNFQAAADGTVADLSAGESDIIVMYGSERLTPSIKNLRRGEFKVSLASSKHDENITCGSIIPDANIKKFTVGPAGKGSHKNMTADSASITYTIEVYTQDGDQHTFEKVQSFTKSKDGWDGSAGKTLKLSADDYQIAYDQHGLAPTPSVINVEAEPGGTSESLKYKFYLNNVAVTDWQDSNTHQFASPAQHENFDKMFIKVEATTNETESPVEVYAHDSISIIGTKEGENVVRISNDNPSHSFTVDADGGILPADYDVGAINFNLYFGNAELAPNTAATFDPEADEASLLASFTNLDINQFAVNAEPSDSTLDLDDPGRNVDGQTISCSPSVNGNILKYTPSNFGSGETAAAIVFTFYARVTAETIMGPYTVTQTFSKSREGQQGEQGPVGPDGVSAKATKLSADDYQVAYNAAGKNPDPTIVTLTATNQNMLEVQNIEYRFTEDGNTTGKQTSNTYVLDVEDISYSDFNKKKNIKVEVFEGGDLKAEDSVSIIATKEGSNAVEIVGDNLSHQFTADSIGSLDDPESGNNSFEVYIGNTQLTPVQDRTDAAWTDANAKNVFTAEATYTGVSGVNSEPFTVEDVNGQPLRLQHSLENASMPGDFGSIEFTIYVKDSDGEDRGPYKKKQTLTVSKEALNAKSVMLTADSYVFPFDETSSTVPRTGEGVITATMKLENVGKTWAAAPVVSVYATGEISSIFKSKDITITGTTDANGSGELQFQIDYDELKTKAKGDTGKVKGWLPLRVQASVGNGTYSDTMNIWALDGGSNSVQAIIPNNNHGFVSEEDGTVLPEYLGVGGSGVTVFEAGVPIDFDKDLAWEDGNGGAIFLNTDEVGNPTWNFKKAADISDDVVRYTSKNNMVVVSIDNTNGNIVVDSVDKDVDNDTIDVEIFVRRSTGEGVTLPMTLSYNKAKKGQKGKDVKNVNGDFSEGPVGWSAMEGDAEFTNAGLTPEDLLDLGADLFRVAPHDDAEHGENVGIFKPYSNPSVGFGAQDYFWNSKSVAIGRGGRWDFDLRARTGGVGSVAPGHKMRWWIRLYKTNTVDPTSSNYVDGAPITYTIKDIAIRNKDMRDNPSQAHPNPYVVVNSWTPAGQASSVDGSTLEEAALTNTEFNDHKISFTPSQFQEILSGASSFRVGIEFIPAGTDVVELIVDCCKATYSMFGSIVDLDPVWKAGVETTTGDLQSRWGHLVDEQSDQNPEALFNGKLGVLAEDNYPQGILLIARTGKNTSKPTRDYESSKIIFTGTTWSIGNDSAQRGIAFKAVKIPSLEHNMKIKISYFKYNPLSNDTHPSVYVYFSEDDLTGDQKYIRSKTDAFQYSDAAGADPAAADYTDSPLRSENAVYTRSDGNLFSGPYNFDETGAENNLKTKEVIISFDPDSSHPGNSNVAGESPKWATIVLFGATTTTAHELKVKEVSLEWELKTANIISKSMQETLASQTVIDMNSNTSAAQAAADAAQLTATTASDTASSAWDMSTDAHGIAQMTQNSIDDMVTQTAADVNGNFLIKNADGKPSGWAVSYHNGPTDKLNGYTHVEETSYSYMSLLYEANNAMFSCAAIPVPENHYVEFSMEYRYRDWVDSDSERSIRFLWTEDDLSGGEKYLTNRNTSLNAFNPGKGLSSGDFSGQANNMKAVVFGNKSSWTQYTFRGGFDWLHTNPKFFGMEFATQDEDSSKFDIRNIKVVFKKDTYRSGVSYPSDAVPQKGDQFFRVTDKDDWGYLTTYGKNFLDFNVPVPTKYSNEYSWWPPQILVRWQNSAKDEYLKMTSNPGSDGAWSLHEIGDYGPWVKSVVFHDGYWGLSNTFREQVVLGTNNIYYHDTDDDQSNGNPYARATYKSPLFGPCKIGLHYFPGVRYKRPGVGTVMPSDQPQERWLRYQKAIDEGIFDGSNKTVLQIKYEDKTEWENLLTVNHSTYGDSVAEAYLEAEVESNKFFEIRVALDARGSQSSGWSWTGDKDLANTSDYDPDIGVWLISKIEINGFFPTVDEGTSTNVMGIADQLGTNFVTFTGQHKCVLEGEYADAVSGKIVSSTGRYDNLNHDSFDIIRHKVNPKEAVPTVVISNLEKDKKVLGVVCGKWREAHLKTPFLIASGFRDDDQYVERYEINSLGEGGIWVSDSAGFLENGDYICSSNIPGYGMKQDDDILRNYTVAKITQDCYFDLESEDYECKEVEHDGETFKVAFVGCTYHCG